MTGLRRFVSRLVELVRGRAIERELDEEIRHHLDLSAEDHRRRGLSAAEARAAARRDFGGVDQAMEQVRDRRGFRPMATFWRDVRFAARTLRRTPGFTIAAILTLALGIGVNTAIFAMVDTVMLRPLPYPEPDRLVALWDTMRPAEGGAPRRIAVAPINLTDYRDRAGDAVGVAGYMVAGRTLVGSGRPERLGAEEITRDYFDVVGIQPALGRAFREEEFTPGNEAVAVITDRLWRSRFNGDSGILGRTIVLDGRPVQVVGVMPPSFVAISDYIQRVDVLVPVALPPDIATGRGEHILEGIGRLRPGVDLTTARERLEAVAASIPPLGARAGTPGADIEPLQTAQVGETRTLLVVLLAAVGLTLLTACANVGGLLIVRALGRRREIAVRVAMGAGRARLLVTFAAESLVLATAGAFVGVAFGSWTTSLLVAAAPAGIPRVDQVIFGGRALVVAALLAGLATFVFAIVPAWQMSRTQPADALQSSSRAVVGGWLQRGRSALLFVQVALSIVLLVGALLMSRSLISLNSVSLGFDPHDVLAAGVTLPANSPKYAEAQARLAFFEQVEARLAAIPGVTAVTFANRLPLRGSWISGLQIEGDATANVTAGYQAVSPGYLETFRIPLRRGRWIAASDRDSTEPVAVVNEAFARERFGGADPIGRRLRRHEKAAWVTIVGVVGDVRRGGRTADLVGQVYVPAAQVRQYPLWLSDLAVRSAGTTPGLDAAVREAIWAVDADQPITRLRTLDETLALGQAAREFQTWLFLLFAALALALAVVGIYGVVAYAVSQRSNEIGLRIALGAGIPRVLRWVVGQAAWPVIGGAALGLAAAWASSRYVTALLYSVAPTDAVSYAGAAALMAVVALAASLVAGRRATRIDPADVLK
ncbi:MAG TPA: ABC transporter permease [Vicinamibacterales bacterium]|nr:ABC transporter permease [Vicinamibacterales bacterium]